MRPWKNSYLVGICIWNTGINIQQKGLDVRLFTRDFLGSLRRKAIRRRVLHCLDELDRGILLLSSKLVDVVSSPTLTSQLMDIVEKLGEALRSRFDRHVESFGIRRVIEMVRLAIGFGSDVARGWMLDSGFSRYLAFMDINGSFR